MTTMLVDGQTKVCTKCLIDKHLSEFYPHKLGRFGKATRCKHCSNAATRESRKRTGRQRDYEKERRRDPQLRLEQYRQFHYGLSPAAYEELERKQDGKCAICRVVPTGTSPRTSRLHVDHCHTTGVVRGLLCHRCNLAIGLLRDDRDLVSQALEYLQ